MYIFSCPLEPLFYSCLLIREYYNKLRFIALINIRVYNVIYVRGRFLKRYINYYGIYENTGVQRKKINK